MASTYTTNNGIELIATGEKSGTWGDITNVNLELIDASLDGQVTFTLTTAGSSSVPTDLPIANGTATNSEGRNRLVIFDDGGDLGATAYVRLTPSDAEKIVYIRNSLSASRDIIVFQGTYSASNDYVVPNGTTAVIYFDGAGPGAVAANIFNNAYFDALNIGGASTFSGAVSVLDTLTLKQSTDTFVMNHTGSRVELKEPVATSDGVTIASDGTITVTDGDTTTKRIETTKDGSIELFYAGTKKIETTTDGVTVDGKLTTTSIEVDGGSSTMIFDSTYPHGTDNVGIGLGTFNTTSTTGGNNTAIGVDAGSGVTSGGDNTYIGYRAGYINTTGSDNVAIGSKALDANTTGGQNVAIGYNAANALSSFSGATAVGYFSLALNTGSNNAALGHNSLANNTSGSQNTAVGSSAHQASAITPITGSNNSAFGETALQSAGGAASNNTAIGQASLSNLDNGYNHNTAVGQSSGSAITAGQGNTLLGRYTGSHARLDITTSDYHIVLSSGTGVPEFWIDNSGHCFIYGTASNTTASAANVFIDSTTGELFRSTSSLRYKENIQDASHGLSDLMLLRPVTYTAKDGDDTLFGGLIAEDVHEAGLTEFVDYDDEGRPDALHYGHMVSLCVKAIQELKEQLEAAKKRISDLEE